MRKSKIIGLGLAAMLPLMGIVAQRSVPDDDPTTKNVIDEVLWVVGDEPILKSEVEGLRLQAEMEGLRWKGDPDCAIPERIAVEKLFLHQAAIDSIEVTESEIASNIEQRLEFFIQQAGSREKLEEWRGQTIAQMRAQMHDELRNQMMIQRMRAKLVEDITVSPAEVRRYFSTLPVDSIPFVPTEVEVQIITRMPKIDQEEIDRIKDELREYTDRVNSGETTFQTLARLYSEDGSARNGGELGYTGRGQWVPEFANVAFNLTDPKKVSKIVETEFGFHIIQLIDKRGDKVNVRHILRKPRVSDAAVDTTMAQLDTIAADLRRGKFSFEEAVTVISDDKDTRNNHGLMAKSTEDNSRTSKFRMQDLPPEVARAVERLQPGEVSPAFKMINQSNGRTVCAIVKLKSRVDGHKATITEDFQVMKNVVQNKRSEEKLDKWVENKIKTIYVRVNDRYKDCHFEHQGWIK